MRVVIEDLVLTSDPRQYILGTPTTVTNKDTGEETEELRNQRYYSTIEQVLNAIFERKVRASQAVSFEDLARDVRQAREDIRRYSKLFDGMR